MTQAIESVSPKSVPTRLARRRLGGVLLTAVMVIGPGGTGHGQVQGADARQAISDLYAALQAAMRMGPSASFQQRFDRIAPVVDRVFDLDAILRTSVGLRWSSLDETARRTLFSVFRTFTIASYAANFDKDGGEKFQVLPQIRTSGADQIIQTHLIASNGEPIRIDYVMHAGPLGWRVVDVLLDGSISRVAVQRSDFRALLVSGGPGPLIESLKRKIVELSDGAIRP
jgi:phospholipid transport system substrate-binding protein